MLDSLRMKALVSIGLLAAALWSPNSPAGVCTGHGVEVQVLGSGGPELEDRRASSSYLIWQDHVPRVLVDAGSGSALNFGFKRCTCRTARPDAVHPSACGSQRGFRRLDQIILLRIPASGPCPQFMGRPRGAITPSMTEFVADLFGRHGAYRYLARFLAGEEGGYLLQPHSISVVGPDTKVVYRSSGLAASATRVVHGQVPALAWRVELAGRSIVLSGDTNGDNGHLERLVQNADVFVAHNAVPEGATGVIRNLHMPPSVIGRIAHAGDVKMLVLSHRMLRTLGQERATLQAIAGQYSGPVAFADDLDCF